MTYQPPGGTPDPYQPPPYGRNDEPTTPYPHDPYASPASGAGQPGAYGSPVQYPGEPYGQGPYGPPQYPAYGVPARTNSMAIASLICSLGGLATCISAPVGIVLGHIARRQIRQTGEQGMGLATAGLWIGYILTFLGIAGVALFVIAIVISGGNTTT